MIYAAVIDYARNPDLIAEVRPKHREYLAQLKANNELVASGPFLDDSGALIVYRADTPDAAESLIRNDPFHAAGVFVSWKLRPWKLVYVNSDLLPK